MLTFQTRRAPTDTSQEHENRGAPRAPPHGRHPQSVRFVAPGTLNRSRVVTFAVPRRYGPGTCRRRLRCSRRFAQAAQRTAPEEPPSRSDLFRRRTDHSPCGVRSNCPIIIWLIRPLVGKLPVGRVGGSPRTEALDPAGPGPRYGRPTRFAGQNGRSPWSVSNGAEVPRSNGAEASVSAIASNKTSSGLDTR